LATSTSDDLEPCTISSQPYPPYLDIPLAAALKTVPEVPHGHGPDRLAGSKQEGGASSSD
jgi:hypothetical protein